MAALEAIDVIKEALPVFRSSQVENTPAPKTVLDAQLDRLQHNCSGCQDHDDVTSDTSARPQSRLGRCVRVALRGTIEIC